MRYEMKNFIKITKKPSNVGQSGKPKRDDWKRDRKIARQNKINLRKSVA
jgi:hypothetical protein